jgi:hypothetical protein
LSDGTQKAVSCVSGGPNSRVEELAEAHAGQLFDEITSAQIVINK